MLSAADDIQRIVTNSTLQTPMVLLRKLCTFIAPALNDTRQAQIMIPTSIFDAESIAAIDGSR